MPDLQPIRSQISRGFVANFAQELTEVVVIQLINQMQKSISSGELAKQLFQSQKQRYLDINNINEIEAKPSKSLAKIPKASNSQTS